jgi:hypothetical protein
MRVLWSAFAVFMPKSALEKTVLCTGKALATTPDASMCPFIKRWCNSSTASIPDFLGGNMQCPDALKPRSECSNSLIKVTVNARSSQTIEVFELFAVLVRKYLLD